jgi:hypothetical protein
LERWVLILRVVQAFTNQNMSSNHPSLKEKNVKLLKEVDEWVAEAGCAPRTRQE